MSDYPWQWQRGGACVDIRNGAFVDKDACEGSYADWELDQAMTSTYSTPAPKAATPTAFLKKQGGTKLALAGAGLVGLWFLFTQLGTQIEE